jgi:DNA-binding MurR/RpiR family transcriptional regulator
VRNNPTMSEAQRATVAEEIRGRMPSLTTSERRVARALLAAYPIAGLEPLSKLVARAGVSPPTALRFVAKAGFDGYPDFQQRLREEVQLRIDSPASRYAATGGVASDHARPQAEFRTLIENLETTGKGIDSYEFNSVIDLLLDSRRRVIALGGVISRALAAHLVRRLAQLRPGVSLSPENSSRVFDQIVDLRRGDVVVAFDYKRYQQDTNAFMRRASQSKAVVILCTDQLHLCPGLEVADHVLTFSIDGPPPFDSPIGGFALVEALASRIAARLGESGRHRITRMEDENSGWMWDETLFRRLAVDAREYGVIRRTRPMTAKKPLSLPRTANKGRN